MKRGIFLVAVFVMAVMLSLAAVLAETGKADSLASSGKSNSPASVASVAGSDNTKTTAIRIKEEEDGARNVSELKIMIAERKLQMDAQAKNMSEKEQKVYKNQNVVRTAVHALLAVRNLTGGIGQNVSAIAREFNNSVQATLRAETKIEKRNKVKRFFLGGDNDAAAEIEANVGQNGLRIKDMNKLMNECNCSAEVKAVIREQVQNMETEQTRLQQVVQQEKKSKGILGWLLKR
jgi:hypothetical protein